MEKTNKSNKSTNAFTPREWSSPELTQFEDPDTNDIVEYEEYDKFEKTGDGDQDIVVVKDVREYSRMNRRDYINSFRDDVGIENILKKCSLTGDMSLLNQTRRTNLSDPGTLEPIQDMTNLPDNKMDAYRMVEKGVQSFDSLPDELKNKQSIEAFVKSVTEKAVNDYVASIQPKITTEKVEKGE